MGWSSGTSLMGDFITSMKKHRVDYKARLEIYKDMINAFEDKDCDNLFECLGEDFAFDEAYKIINPEDFNQTD